MGLGGPYGDLMDVVRLLVQEPLTRQAVLPIFFPEDTGNRNPGRKPCSLLYQFRMREGRLHVYYPLRSCDFVRHWRDDVYLTIRLLLWVIEKCREIDPALWGKITPGRFVMYCGSLHIFKNDYIGLFQEKKS
jgi:thymidylate synthase